MTPTDVLHDDPVAAPRARGPRDDFAQMLAALDAQLDHDLAGLADTGTIDHRPVQPAPTQAPVQPAPTARAVPPRGMLAPAAAVVATIGVVACAAILIALHWRPTRSIAASVPVASALPAPPPAPLALAVRADAVPPAAAPPSCPQAQTALGLCTSLTTLTTTPESSP